MRTELASDTWGVSGPHFLLGYTPLVVVTLIGTWAALRRTWCRSPYPAAELNTRAPVELALLTGGERAAVLVALVELRSAGLITKEGRLTRRPHNAWGLDPLTAAVRGALDPKTVRRLPDVLHDPAVVTALSHVRGRLRKSGLLAPRPRLGDTLLVLAPLLVLVGLGGARLAAGIANHRPTALLVLVLAVEVVGLAAVVASWSETRTTTAAATALVELRARHEHLSPAMHPSLETYGRQSLLLSVALFGSAAVVWAEPEFATAVGAYPVSSPGGGGGSDGGGGGCGGGGCGGGCGG